MTFAAVIFDCDGVLVDSEVLSIRGERAALDEMGLHYTIAEYVRRFVGLHDFAFIDFLRADYVERFGRPAPDDFEARIIDGRRREMAALAVVEGAEDALRRAKEICGATGVASSSRAHFLTSKLERTGLAALAGAHVYSADLVARAKPAPDIFLYTAEKMAVDPARCLVVEDSENGVRAGCAAGMTVWGFTGGGHCLEGHGDRLRGAGAREIIPDFAGFIAALDGGGGG